MNTIRAEKEKQVLAIKEKIEKSKVVILTDYRGLTVSEITDLRRELRKVEAEYQVAKNTLINLARGEELLPEAEGDLAGPSAVLYGFSDAVSAVKILNKFFKENEKPQIKVGWLDNQKINEKEIKALASLPSREVLVAQVVGAIAAPLSGLVNVVQGPLRKLVYALQAISDKKGGEK